jgi:TRAP-type C4-dicarboxylate transport system substrate-binding protein
MMLLDDKWTFEQGPFRVVVSKSAINSFNDLRGRKMRVPEVETLQKTWAAFGSAPITVSFGEVYLALEQGMVEGVEVAHSVVRENSYCEVAKYITKIDNFPQRTALIMGKKRFDGLPADSRKIMRDSAYEAGAAYTAKVKENYEIDKKFLSETLGVKYNENLDLKPFRDAMEKLYAEWEKSGYFEPGIVDRIRKL